MVGEREPTGRGVGVERQHDVEPAVGLGVVQAGRVGQERAEPAGVARRNAAVDGRSVAVERVEVDSVVHIPGEPADDVRGGVVWQRGRAVRLVEHVHHLVDRLEDEAVAGAHALVGRLDGELVAAARVPLLVMVEAFEAELEGRVRLGLRSAIHRRAAATSARQADGAVVGIRAGLLIVRALVAGHLVLELERVPGLG